MDCQEKKSPSNGGKSLLRKIVNFLLPNSKPPTDSDASGSGPLDTCSGDNVPWILRGRCALYAQFCFICVSVWIVLFSVSRDQSLPGGNLFSLLVLFTGAIAGGHVFSLIHLPPLLGEYIILMLYIEFRWNLVSAKNICILLKIVLLSYVRKRYTVEILPTRRKMPFNRSIIKHIGLIQ